MRKGTVKADAEIANGLSTKVNELIERFIEDKVEMPKLIQSVICKNDICTYIFSLQVFPCLLMATYGLFVSFDEDIAAKRAEINAEIIKREKKE